MFILQTSCSEMHVVMYFLRYMLVGHAIWEFASSLVSLQLHLGHHGVQDKSVLLSALNRHTDVTAKICACTCCKKVLTSAE